MTAQNELDELNRIGRNWRITGVGYALVLVGLGIGVLGLLVVGTLSLIGIDIRESIVLDITKYTVAAIVGVGCILAMVFEPLRTNRYRWLSHEYFDKQLDDSTTRIRSDFEESDHFIWDEQIASLANASRDELVGRLLAWRESKNQSGYRSGYYYWKGLMEQLTNMVFTKNPAIIRGAMQETQRRFSPK